jgi:cobalt-zinc-cadmium resistance protein CzcA
LVRNVADIEKTVIKTQNGTALRIKDIAVVAQGPKIRLGQIGKAIHRADGVVVDDDDVVEGIVFLRKGADTAATLEGIHATVRRLNEHILPKGVKIVPYLDRDDLVHYTTHTVLHNLAEGMILVVIILFIFLGRSLCCSHLFAWTCGIFPRICSPWERWISAWWWMDRW